MIKIVLLSNHNFIYGTVTLKDMWLDVAREEMELLFLYMDRYQQTVRYEGVYYSEFTPNDKGLYISMAEEMDVKELLEPRFHKSLYRFLYSHKGEKRLLEELKSHGAKLYVNYGKTSDYMVIARTVTVKQN